MREPTPIVTRMDLKTLSSILKELENNHFVPNQEMITKWGRQSINNVADSLGLFLVDSATVDTDLVWDE